MRFEDSAALREAMARRVSRRLKAAGVAAVDIEDVRSELAIAWCIARDSYDPDHGASFKTYLWRGMLNHVRRWVERECGIAATKLHLDGAHGDEDEALDLHEVIAAPDAGPHELLEERQLRALAQSELSPETQRFLALLEAPSPELVEVLEASQARAEFARQRGLRAIAPTAVTAAMVFDLIGATRTERHRAYAEIRRLSDKVSQK